MSTTRLAPLSRRAVIGTGLSASALALTLPALAQRSRGPAQVSVEELMKTELPDIVIGKPDAPVTIVEYASMTCGFCAAFHNTVYPKLKEKYIDTGLARLVFREFPLNNLDAAVNMLSRCVGGEGPAGLIADMFKRQAEWAGLPGPAAVTRLQEMARQYGFTEASFNKCLTDQKLLERIEASRKRANEKFGVESTPTFFVNGRRLAGVTLADFEKAIDPLVKK